QILDSTIFKTRNAVLFITWDEGNACAYPIVVHQTYPTCIDRVPAIFAGSRARQGFVSNAGFSHYSFVKTLEVVWNFPPLTPLDESALPMTGLLDPPRASTTNSIYHTPILRSLGLERIRAEKIYRQG